MRKLEVCSHGIEEYDFTDESKEMLENFPNIGDNIQIRCKVCGHTVDFDSIEELAESIINNQYPPKPPFFTG